VRRLNVACIIIHDELESWLLADSGVCKWLEVKPQSHDEQRKPKERLDSQMKKRFPGLRYQGKGRSKLLEQISGDGDQHSPSMRAALKHLDDAPCTQAETATPISTNV